MTEKTERPIGDAARQNNRKEVVLRMKCFGAVAIYAGLLDYVTRRGWRVGWAAHAFKEIYGSWPLRECRDVEPQPLPDCLVEQWVAFRPKKAIKRDKPAPLVDQVVAQEKAEQASVVNENGFVPGTYMTPEDFEVSWR